MKKLIVSLGLLISSLVVADPPSVHGMLVFGTSRVHLSHLPMFHQPHDYQAIFEVTLSRAALAAYLADKAANPGETVYTLVPQRFVLPDLAARPVPFLGTLFRGHFERGGTPILQGVKVEITKVVHFRKFDPKAVAPATSRYLVFGSPGETYLAHFITQRPDFDQIVLARGATPSETPVEIAGQKNDVPLKEGETVTLGGTAVTITRQLYLEHDDLH